MATLASPSRWISISGLTIGIFFLLFRFFVDGRSLFRAFVEAATASFAAMIVGVVAHRFWSGTSVKFQPPFRLFVEELDAQLEMTNDRLLIVEEAVDALKAAQRRGGTRD